MAQEEKSSVFAKKILFVGGRGTIGVHVIDALHEMRMYGYDSYKLDITVGGSSDQGKEVTINNKKYPYCQIDLTKTESISNALKGEKYDWVIVSGGGGPMGPIGNQTISSFKDAFNSKGFGLIDMVLQANKLINDNGCVVLTTGYLDRIPFKNVSGLCAVNGMINSFVKGAALETERGIKINAVSPGLLTESKAGYNAFLPSQPTVDGKDVALAYIRALISGKNGCIFEVMPPKFWNEIN